MNPDRVGTMMAYAAQHPGLIEAERNPENLSTRLQQVISSLHRCEDKIAAINIAIEPTPNGGAEMQQNRSSSPPAISLASLAMDLLAVSARLDAALETALNKL